MQRGNYQLLMTEHFRSSPETDMKKYVRCSCVFFLGILEIFLSLSNMMIFSVVFWDFYTDFLKENENCDYLNKIWKT